MRRQWKWRPRNSPTPRIFSRRKEGPRALGPGYLTSRDNKDTEQDSDQRLWSRFRPSSANGRRV